MVSARPWNANAITRLVLWLLVCFVCGSFLVGLVHQLHGGHKPDLRYYRLTTAALGCAAAAWLFVYRPLKIETLISRLGGYLVCLYGGILLGTWAQKSDGPSGPSVSQMIIAALSLQGAALVFIPYFLREQQLTWKESFGLGNNLKRALMLGVILACVFLPMGMGLQWLSAQVMVHLPWFELKPRQQESVETLALAVTWLNRTVLGIVTIGVAPAAEEMVFRGILYPAIKGAGFPRLAFWGTAMLFALIHFNLVTFVPLMVLALALTLLYESTDNLLAPITAHALFNALNFAILYSSFDQLSPT